MKIGETYEVKMISSYSGTASMVTHTYNPGIHVCTKEGQDLKQDCLKRRIKTSIWETKIERS